MSRLRARRITLTILILLGLFVSGAVWLGTRERQSLTLNSRAWIGLPPDRDDASTPDVRYAVFSADTYGGAANSLARSCGLGFDEEIYRAHIADDIWSSVWRIDLSVHESRVHALTQKVERISVDARDKHAEPGPTAQAWFSRSELEDLKEAWSAKPIWGTPQLNQLRDCGDRISHSGVFLLEACVNGNYAARLRFCDAGGDGAASRFRDEAWRALPFPTKRSQ